MAFVVACPACQRKLQLPEGCGGASVRCPSCLVTFIAPKSTSDDASGAATGAEVVAITLEPRKEPILAPATPLSPGLNILREARRPWEQLRSGLTWILVGTCIQLPVVLLQVPLWVLFFGQGHWDMDLGFFEYGLVGWCGYGLFHISWGICTVVGLFRCSMSYIQGMRSWLGFAALGLILLLLLPRQLVTPRLYDPFDYFDHWIVIGLVVGIGNYLGQGFLLLYIREVGRILHDKRTLSRFRWLVAWFILFACVSLGSWLSIVLIEDFVGWPFAAFDLVEHFILWASPDVVLFALLIQQIRLLMAARRAVRKHLATLGPAFLDPEEDLPRTTSTPTTT